MPRLPVPPIALPRARRAALVATLLSVVLAPAAGRAAEIPACRPEIGGVVACLAGRLCSCRFERGSRATGVREGWRWDCGILRPACGGGPETPAMTGDYPEVLAPALGLDLALKPPRPRPPRPPAWSRP